MIYLSQLINRRIYYKNKPLGKVLDLAITNHTQYPKVSKFHIKFKGRKVYIPSTQLVFDEEKFVLLSKNPKTTPLGQKEFLLNEDLMDKQVIDVNNKKLVRVNDVCLRNNKGLELIGIDIGSGGIFRRLGLGQILKAHTVMIPWELLEAFDYQTGDVKVKISESKLDTLHPADIADILEEVGSKERAGLMEALGSRKAAQALQEADEETQIAILEETPKVQLKEILDQFPTSEIADILTDLSDEKTKLIYSLLSDSKAQELKHLTKFSDDVAGGLMDKVPYLVDGRKTVRSVLVKLSRQTDLAETLVLLNKKNEFLGVVLVKDLINKNPKLKISELIYDKNFVRENTSFTEIIKLFAEYNLRHLPVLDSQNHVSGAIGIDSILKLIHESEEREDAI